MGTYYSVSLGNHQVGKVQVIKEGLYYRFICCCQLPKGLICRLYVACGEKKESLGVVIPIAEGFGLDTKIPIKRIGAGKMAFCLLPKHTMCSHFVPIYPEEPFSYIEKLKDGFLSIQNGQPGLCLSK